MRKSAPALLIVFTLFSSPAFAFNEVIEDTHTKVVVKQQIKTGKQYVSIVPETDPEPAVLPVPQSISRPDYRMLDPKIKSGEIPYEGPSSSRKKVYIFAASVATLGAVGGTAIIAAAPAATGAGAASGAGAFAAAGGAVTAGTISAAWLKTRPDPKKDDFSYESKSKLERNNGNDGKK